MTKVGEHITLDIIGTTKEYNPSLYEKVIRFEYSLNCGTKMVINTRIGIHVELRLEESE